MVLVPAPTPSRLPSTANMTKVNLTSSKQMKVVIEGHPVLATLDSGCSICFMGYHLASRLRILPYKIEFQAVRKLE